MGETGLGYIEKLKCFIKKSLSDEISASIFYAKAANELTGIGSSEVSEELKSHSKEEFDHFNELLEFSSSHGFGIDMDIALDTSVSEYTLSSSPQEIMRKVQELESSAIKDYKDMAVCAQKHGDIETAKFFRELMGDEIRHFDDLAYVNGDKREVSTRCEISAEGLGKAEL